VSRKKISEYRAKHIVNELIGMPYHGWVIDAENEVDQDYGSTQQFVVKVDQAVKQRFKKGLIHLNVAKADLSDKYQDLINKGYQYLVVEPFFTHSGEIERYLSFRREKDGVIFSYSQSGGVDIEANADTIKSDYFEKFDLEQLAIQTGLSIKQLEVLRFAFDNLYMTLLEINPYVISNDEVYILDAAIEVDSSAELLVNDWNENDIRTPAAKLTEEELVVRKVASESPASFSLDVINPDGSIFLLLSGGGASVVIADEIFTLGKGKELANYGEYSGNPNEEETQIYSEQVIKLLLKSKAKKKVLFIGGAVANFTDIASTFRGIIRTLNKHSEELADQGVRIYVRRGGPRQDIGLAQISEALNELGLMGGVYNPSVSIPTAVKKLVEGLK
jgi:ATP-citrate lyase beta-subunit